MGAHHQLIEVVQPAEEGSQALLPWENPVAGSITLRPERGRGRGAAAKPRRRLATTLPGARLTSSWPSPGRGRRQGRCKRGRRCRGHRDAPSAAGTGCCSAPGRQQPPPGRARRARAGFPQPSARPCSSVRRRREAASHNWQRPPSPPCQPFPPTLLLQSPIKDVTRLLSLRGGEGSAEGEPAAVPVPGGCSAPSSTGLAGSSWALLPFRMLLPWRGRGAVKHLSHHLPPTHPKELCSGEGAAKHVKKPS